MGRHKQRWMPLVAGVAVSVLAAGCATTRAPGTRPDDMSYAEHMRASRKFKRAAAKHEKRYDPNAERVTTTIDTLWISDPHSLGDHISGVPDVVVENPTEKHLDHARRRREIARQHAAAARALKRYEQRYCKGTPVAKRGAHPLRGRVLSVKNIPGGVRLQLKPGVSPTALRNKMACHIAHARLNGFAGEKNCPLHLRGIRFRVAPGGGSIELMAKRARLVPELRRRARATKGL